MECLINDLPIYYEEYGDGMPVLCLHGFTLDHRVMKGCLEPIFQKTAGYRRIYLDLPGMGNTPAGEWINNADTMLDTVKKFIDKVIGDESLLVVGYSYGGYLLIGLAMDSHLKIEGMFLIAPCTIADYSKRKLPVKNNVFIDKGLASFAKSPADFTDFLEAAVIATKETWIRYKSEILPGLKKADINFLKHYRKTGYGFIFECDLKRLEFNKPLFVLTGKQDNFVGYEDTWELLKHLPQLTFTVLGHAGHNLQIEKVALFNLYLNEWLKQVDWSEF